MARITINDISEQLKKDGWKLISDSYKNLDEELIYECAEGHRVYGPWRKFRNKLICPECKKNEFKRETIKITPKPKDGHRVLALDQATYITGWSIFDDNKLVAYGKFETNLAEDIERYDAVKKWLNSMILNWQPDIVGLEGIQFQSTSNGKNVMGVTVFETLARLQGILMETCFEEKIQYVICPTNTWRAHCGVKGKSRDDKKRNMQLLVKKWYDVSVSEDESDAIGIGKYCADSYKPTLFWEDE